MEAIKISFNKNIIKESNDFNLDFNFEDEHFNNNESNYYTLEDFSSNVIKFKNNIKNDYVSVIHLNARSLFHKLSNLEILLNQFHNFFKIVVISETWLTNETANLIKLNNYNFVYKNRTNKRGGGVGMFIKQDVKYIENDDSIFDDDDIDMLCVDIEEQSTSPGKTLKVIAIYRPPNYKFEFFINKIELILNHLKPSDNTLIIGDLNVNLLDNNSNNSKDFQNLLFSHCYSPLINLPTRITSNTSSLIDNIFTNLHQYCESGIIVSDFSDHFPVYAIIENFKTVSIDDQISKRKINKMTTFLIKEALSIETWQSVINEHNIDVACSKFYKILNEILDKYAPLRPQKRKNKKAWITNDIIKLSHKQYKLYKKAISSPNIVNVKKYRQFRNYFTSMKRKAEKIYFQQKFEEAKRSSKQKWVIINEIMNRNTNNNNINKLKVDNKIVENTEEICNIFNKYFIDVTEKLLENQIIRNELKINSVISKSVYMDSTNEEEVMSIVKNLSNKKSTSDDMLSNNLLKKIIQEIVVPITYIFNLSITQGIFPNCFKISKIIPIYKKGSKLEMSNYRPISLLSPLSKVLEKIIFIRITSFLTVNKLLNENQYGYRAQHSTELAVLQLAQNVMNNLNEKILTVGVFIDLSKAFDVINHDILIKKLHAHGIRGIVNAWFKSYLMNREQYVTIKSHFSTKLGIISGVPQGSILGPLLFLIYMNDLQQVTNANLLLYADDTNIFFPTKDPVNDLESINSSLEKISTWFINNKLIINYSKCNYILFGPKILTNLIPDIDIRINNKGIPRTTHTKFLGVTIKDNLSWDLHIHSLSNKINKTLGVINKINFKINRSIIIDLYYSLIFPHLIYCCLIWGNSPDVHLKQLSKCQNRFIRILLNLHPFSHTSEYYPKLKILNIKHLYIYHVSIFIFKFLRHQLPAFYKNFFTFGNNVQSRTTRHTQLFYNPPARIKLLCLSLKHTGPGIWETLPLDIKDSISLHLFKNKLKTYLVTKSSLFLRNINV